MSATSLEWMVVLLFFLLFGGVIAGEIVWLVAKKWTTTGRAAALVITSNIVSLTIGSFLVGTIMFIMFMMVMGPAGRGSDAPESAYIIGIALALIIPPVLLIAAKRIMLAVLKIRSGSSAWIYSVVSTLLTFLITLVPTVVFIYFISYISRK
ncbi:MAG: hypothetical protein ABL999_05965 [Pyrinomonadaceae bacterium]